MDIATNIMPEYQAILSSEGELTSFSFADQNIRFRTSAQLERYTSVKVWDDGYIVVMAKYKGHDEEEEYIDLIPILANLHIDRKLLKPINEVIISYDKKGDTKYY